MNKWKISAVSLTAIGLLWFLLGFSYIAYCLARGIDFFFAWILFFVAPCSLAWYISFRCIRKSQVPVLGVPSRPKELPSIEGKIPIYKMETLARKSSAKSYDARTDLLNKINVYAEGLYYLATCGPFDASKFEKLDEILSKAGGAIGSDRRQEMLSKFLSVLSTKTKEGGLEGLRVMLGETLQEGITTFNKALVKVSPTPLKDAEEVVRILEKYQVPTRTGARENIHYDLGMSAEKMEEKIKFYKNEAKACAGIGVTGIIVGFLASIQTFSVEARPYGSGFLLLSVGILLIGVPYYLLKAIKLKSQTKKV